MSANLASSNVFKPTAKMVRFVDALLEGDENGKPLSVRRACDRAGIHQTTPYKSYFKNPDFMAYLKQRRREKSRAFSHTVDFALIAKALKGDVQAIRLFYERYEESGSVSLETFNRILEQLGIEAVLAVQEAIENEALRTDVLKAIEARWALIRLDL